MCASKIARKSMRNFPDFKDIMIHSTDDLHVLTTVFIFV